MPLCAAQWVCFALIGTFRVLLDNQGAALVPIYYFTIDHSASRPALAKAVAGSKTQYGRIWNSCLCHLHIWMAKKFCFYTAVVVGPAKY